MNFTSDEIYQIFCHDVELIKKGEVPEWFPDLEPKRKEETACCRGWRIKKLIAFIMNCKTNLIKRRR